MKPFLLFFSLIFWQLSYAQQSFKLSGLIKDKRGEALPGAGIYVSGYKIATVSDNNGAFILNLKSGNYDLLVQLIGYKALNKNVVIADRAVKIDIILEESVTQLADVTIKPDPNRQYYINLFRDFFIGTTPNAEECKIVNPNVLIIDYEKDDSRLTVKTNQFLIVDNQALGYRIKYLLNEFQYDYKSKIIYFEGHPYYEDLKGSQRRKRMWEKKRLMAYQGSPQHFFKSLYQKRTTEEGFIINKLIIKPNPDKPSDSLIKAKISSLTKDKTNINEVSLMFKNDSLGYWIRMRNLPAEISILNRATVNPDTLVRIENDRIKKINFTDKLFISYTKEMEDPYFKNRKGLSLTRPPDMSDYQISTITLQVAPVYFYENGGIYNPRSMLYSGYWAWEKIADSVPMDYVPDMNQQDNRKR